MDLKTNTTSIFGKHRTFSFRFFELNPLAQPDLFDKIITFNCI